jgi:tetratricopeptide (TPR) repeat protein
MASGARAEARAYVLSIARPVNRFSRLWVCALAWLSVATGVFAQPASAVKAWEGTLALPTTVEGPADPNPPFDLFAGERFNYPYALRNALTGTTRVEHYRALFLENEYLKVTVLPELGGHLYSCLDKISGHEMFYANKTIKKALIGYRGAWAAFGMEFNFPVSHNWMSVSPVASAIVPNADGSASIWVGDTNALFGSSWRVELRLRPGRAVLEQHTTLMNQSDARHRYYWWTNAAVQVEDDSRLIYPTYLMATHGFTAVVPWPIDEKGRDLSLIRNQTNGPVSLFTYGTREPFIGVWHPSTRFGTVHVASTSELPASKVWSWGFDDAAHRWRQSLSDDDTAYIELQAGLFRNQETYGMLEPQEQVRFSEYWIPARDIGGITRATPDAILNISARDHVLSLEVSATRTFPDARVRVRQGQSPVYDKVTTLVPRVTWRTEVSVPGESKGWTVELLRADGAVILSHDARGYDALTPADGRPGPRQAIGLAAGNDRTEADYVAQGHDEELNGRRLDALVTYQEGLGRFPNGLALNKAAGRLATSLNWAERGEAVSGTTDRASLALRWLTTAHERDTTDMETRYYLGLADSAQGRDREALGHFEAAQRFAATAAPARLQLARMASRAGDLDGALRWLRALLDAQPGNTGAGALEVSCLRRAKRLVRARERLAHWRAFDPTSLLLRYESVRLGAVDARLWRDLGADSQHVLDLVDQYLALGDYDGALDLLSRAYPAVAAPASEPGAVAPADNPLLAYYRGFVRQQMGASPGDDFRAAGNLPLTYVFPSRRTTYAVLNAALAANPADGRAMFLRGSLRLADGLFDAAIDDWNQARTRASAIPTLARNLGMTLLHFGRVLHAVEVLTEGIATDSRNVEVYTALDAALSARESPPSERVAALERYPDQAALPPALVYRLALAKAEDGETRVDALFRDRYFPPEEGGTGPERVLVAARALAARTLAASGHCDAAKPILDGLTKLDAGMPLARQAMTDAVRDPLVQIAVSRVEASCGRTGGRRAEAEPKLGAPYSEARRLAASGRIDDARELLHGVFLQPDRRLSHAMARMLLADLKER